MELSDLREIKRWVLWWGAEVEVVEPEELREMVREEVERVGRMYCPSVLKETS
ncbi:MAG: WYL domain-containing protein [Rhodopirellula sp.]|nr:WYL domain-containing protein [Rhodopirellula sp.]